MNTVMEDVIKTSERLRFTNDLPLVKEIITTATVTERMTAR